jgi:hypothetical protein
MRYESQASRNALDLATGGAFFIVSRIVKPDKKKPYKRLVLTLIAVVLLTVAIVRVS